MPLFQRRLIGFRIAGPGMAASGSGRSWTTTTRATSPPGSSDRCRFLTSTCSNRPLFRSRSAAASIAASSTICPMVRPRTRSTSASGVV